MSHALDKILKSRMALGAFAACAVPAAAAVVLTFALALSFTSGARAGLVESGGLWPRSDRAATKMVRRSRWERRADNYSANHAIPTRAQLRAFHAQRLTSYAQQVTGHYTGTTDEIIQWAAHKWGFDPQLLRAVAAVESWWHMSVVGNNGTSFGLFQVRAPYHCQRQSCYLMSHDTALNADYYGAMLRSYYSGQETWLNTVAGNGSPYRAHDLWGSVGFWSAGHWHVSVGEVYVAKVKAYLSHQVWLGHWF
jgi:hypothetical protein